LRGLPKKKAPEDFLGAFLLYGLAVRAFRPSHQQINLTAGNYIIPFSYETQGRIINPSIQDDIIKTLIIESLKPQLSSETTYFFDGNLKLSIKQTRYSFHV